MNEIAELADQIYAERVRRPHRLSIEEKIIAGGELFDYASGISRSAIRSQNPTLTDEEVLKELLRRLFLGRQLETIAPLGGI